MRGLGILLLSMTVVVCSALSSPQDVKLLRAQRGLQKRHHEWTNACKTAHCYINFWDRLYDGDVDTCRQAALPVFKACLQQVLESSDICSCGYKQVQRDMDKLDDHLICEKEIRPPAYYGYTECEDPQAEACRQKSEAFWAMTKGYNLPSVADRKQALSEAASCSAGVLADGISTVGCTNAFTWAGDMDATRSAVAASLRRQALSEAASCSAGVLADGISTVGCTNAFTWAGDMDATRSAVAAYVFAQGCDDVDGILSECTPPEAITVEACNGEYDDVLRLLDCAKGLVSKGCQSMVRRAGRVLQQAKYAACQRLQQVKAKVDSHCDHEEEGRTLLKRLLRLLTAKNKQ